MPFGPNNAPGFYSNITNKFKGKWDILFIETLRKIGTFVNEQVTVTETDEVFIGDKNIISGSRGTIDDILLLCTKLQSILVYFEYLCKLIQNTV